MAKNQLMDAVRRLHIENGDVLVVQRLAISNEEVHQLSDRLVAMGKRNVLVMAIDDPDNIKKLNEIDMNRLGWFRATSVIPLRKIAEEEVKDEPVHVANPTQKHVLRHRSEQRRDNPSVT